ncbi:MAG: recombinase family protein [Reichenbachiella sp.]|uniref:recombinase family protein n=1 Tax=Reichenbachiella sp. TaxID=2184521 RepID=UPI003266EBFE
MKKYAIYCRVSTNDGRQSNENQVVILTDHCRSKGWDFDIYNEEESSRKTRPIKAALLKKLRDREYQGVLIYKLDRWARSSRELLLEIDELIKKDIDFISVTDNLDFSTAQGRLHFHILSAFSEFERSLISERTKSALARIGKTKKLGRPVGSKDRKKRKTDGYVLREYNKKIESIKQSSPK